MMRKLLVKQSAGRLCVLCVCIMIGMIFSGCGDTRPESNTENLSETSVTFSDDLGREITVDRPERVAALLGSFAQVWMLSGGTVQATVDDAWEDLHLELPESAVNLGNTKDFSLEKLFEADPDFIIASTNTRQNMELKETLEATGVPVAYFDIADFSDYLRLLDICTDITGQKERYDIYGMEVQEQMEAVLEHSRERIKADGAPRVLSLRASASSITAKNSEDNVLGEMLKNLGCVNIADSDQSLLENLSIEHIITEDPDYIFIVQRGDDVEGMKEYVNQTLMEHPLWSKLTAVQEERVFFMDKELYHLKPNHRWGEAYEKLESILASE